MSLADNLHQGPHGFCAPEQPVQRKELVQIVRKYIGEHPETSNERDGCSSLARSFASIFLQQSEDMIVLGGMWTLKKPRQRAPAKHSVMTSFIRSRILSSIGLSETQGSSGLNRLHY